MQRSSAPTVLTKLKKWADYESVGEPVGGTKFLPMKTPMSEEIVANWSLEHPPKNVLTVRGLVAGQAGLGRKVGMIIDLSNHAVGVVDRSIGLLVYWLVGGLVGWWVVSVHLTRSEIDTFPVHSRCSVCILTI